MDAALPPFDFAGLYRRYAPAVHRYALFLSGSRAAAEDIVAETFVQVWGARDRVELGTVGSYLLAIARNIFLRGVRNRRLEQQLLDPPDEAGAHPDEARETSEALGRVLRQLSTLPEVDRTALLLRADEGLSYEEIARLLGISPGSARVKVHRARVRLSAFRDGEQP